MGSVRDPSPCCRGGNGPGRYLPNDEQRATDAFRALRRFFVRVQLRSSRDEGDADRVPSPPGRQGSGGSPPAPPESPRIAYSLILAGPRPLSTRPRGPETPPVDHHPRRRGSCVNDDPSAYRCGGHPTRLRQACTAPPIAKPAITTPKIRSKTSIKLVVSCGISLSSHCMTPSGSGPAHQPVGRGSVCQIPESRLIHKARRPFAVGLRDSSAPFLTKPRRMSRSIWSASASAHSRLDIRRSTARSPLRKCVLAH